MKAKGPLKIVLFGAPGVGKGTFAEILSKKEKLKHINMGNILREEIKKKTTIGKEIDKVVTSGNLVSDDLIVRIVKDEITKVTVQKDSYFKGFILDGFPRNLFQCKELDCEKCKGNPKLQRRSDDSEEIVTHRLNTYELTNSPLINFFKNSNCNLVDFEIKRGLQDFDSFYRIVGRHL
ncbi:adenylate kinase 1 [Plasmodium cynomolgi strain B]|uniref:Adenylate kinase 1 n=1 Tax=Plasmodium cynomolgi (strain B) TaxID=1120755 RepID=K6UQQ0_PLACD|nr:adenylate kinase 1 [Plasmodium cynomolgi strain B]GAB65269.1 adenylate kinase 1 [Plasmodium cynomolgi strain B]